jgi:hypothetical protein
MKRVNFVLLVVAVAALSLASVNQITAGQSEYSRPEGILRMKHSPALGINIPIAVWIDGVQAGAFAKGHVYERYLKPGRHDIYASRPGQLSNSWYGTLDVRPGETYSFVVKCTLNQIYLLPVSRID